MTNGEPSSVAPPSPPVEREEGLSREEFTADLRRRKQRKVERWNALADDRDRWRHRGRVYHQEIVRLLRFLVPPGSRVLEIGTTTGDLLAALEPTVGVGIDFSPAMVERAKQKYPQLEFLVGDAEELPEALDGRQFDFVVLSDVVGHLDDVWKALREVRRIVQPQTRLIVTWYSFLWEPMLKLGEKVGLKMPVEQENWLSRHDLESFLSLCHFEVVSTSSRTLLPLPIPLLAPLCNTLLSPLPGFRLFNLIQYLVARPTAIPEPEPLTTSVIVPCRNERGNVRPALERIPPMGPETEVIFCDGHSDDGTVEEIEKARSEQDRYPFRIRVMTQDGKGKCDAVRKAFDHAENDVLFILDADLTVPPEDLPKFYAAVAEGRADFVNGTRLVYPMEAEAMRTANLLGNKFFSLLLSWILGQRIKDTLCGTKVLRRDHQRQLQPDRAYFGNFDPWGDFELLFSAAKRHLRIRDLPVRYRARTFGDSKMNAFRDGWVLLRMSWWALRKLRMKR